MSKNIRSKDQAEVIARQLINNIESFTGQGEKVSTELDFVELVKTRPFTGKRLAGRILNIIFRIPLLVLKRSTNEYVLHRKYVDTKLLNNVSDISGEVSDISGEVSGIKGDINRALDQKVYEMMKLTDALKSELMAEINKDVSPVGSDERVKTKIINEKKLKTVKKLNLGSGSHILEDYVNVDHRAIEGVDLVSDIRDLPLEVNTIEEILVAHVVEHFTDLKMNDIITYWYSLLKSGGFIKVIVPDIESMIYGFTKGDISWDNLRQVVLGGQDYNSDYHFNMFSERYLIDYVTSVIPKAKIEITAKGRKNGEALELEAIITKP